MPGHGTEEVASLFCFCVRVFCFNFSMTVSGTERSTLFTYPQTHAYARGERLCNNLPLVVVVIFVRFDFLFTSLSHFS